MKGNVEERKHKFFSVRLQVDVFLAELRYIIWKRFYVNYHNFINSVFHFYFFKIIYYNLLLL